MKINHSLIASENYSTTESVVGTWINGKPIYRKVITTTAPSISSQTWREISLGSLTNNVQLFTKIEGVCRFVVSSGYRQMPIPRAHDRELTNQIGLYLTGSGNNTNDIRVELGANYYDKTIDIYIFLEYIKTTD